ncbi:MAG: hypothetical protein H6739_13385 [Alphaproteobacteria bacterium]|nr:hypothetical protein [Alphaproteobacteria bacterium]
MDVDVTWPLGRTLQPRIAVLTDLGGAAFDEVEIQPSLDQAYAWLDACADARARGAPEPDPIGALLPAQVAALEVIRDGWPGIEHDLRQAYPARLRDKVRWGGLVITSKERGGYVYVRLSGHMDTLEETAWSEHGLGAVLLGAEILVTGDRGVSCDMPVDKRRRGAPRPHPDHVDLSEEAILAFIERDDWSGLSEAMKRSQDGGRVDGVLLRYLLTRPAKEVRAMLPGLKPFLRAGAERLPDALVDGDVDRAVLRALLRAGRYHVPGDVLFDEAEPARIPRWIALGAKLEATRGPEGDGPKQTPLLARVGDLPVFTALLEAGARVEVLRNEYGGLLVPLDEAHLDAVERAHPGFRATLVLPDQQPMNPVLTFWMERGWIELTPNAERGRVGAALEGLLELTRDPDDLLNALFKVPGVDEVYVSDEELEAFLATW